MTLPDADRGLVFVGTADGATVRVVRDELGLVPRLVQTTLLQLVEQASTATAIDFLAALNERGAAFDWQVTMSVAGQSTPMHLAGTVHEGLLFIAAAGSRAGLIRLSEEAVALHQDASVQPDRRMYEDLSRVNNQLHNLQRELVKKTMELEKLNEQKNRILGVAAHDLRSPLGVILSYSQFLEEDAWDVLSPAQREFVTTIRDTSTFMLQMVTDLLDVTAIEAGQLILNRQSTDLGAVIRRNVRHNQVLSNPKEIVVSLEPLPSLEPIWIDAGKVEQVLNNLISNAVKFSRRGSSVRILVTSSNQCVTVAVRDEGQGIPATDLSKLFKPFSKASVRGTEGEQSTGLGLAIARNIVEGHGGRLWVESEVGRGSTFFFTLPAAPARRPYVGGQVRHVQS